jgi:hypothetical protein
MIRRFAEDIAIDFDRLNRIFQVAPEELADAEAKLGSSVAFGH